VTAGSGIIEELHKGIFIKTGTPELTEKEAR